MVEIGIFLPIFCYFSKSLERNYFNLCFKSLRYVVYETTVKTNIALNLQSPPESQDHMLEKNDTKLSFLLKLILP